MTATQTSTDRGLRTRAYLALSGVVLFWGLNFPIAKFALDELSPTAFNALRFPLASLFIYVVYRVQGDVKMPRGKDLRTIILLGLLGNVLYQNLFIFGLAHTRAGTASVLLAGSPIITALLSARVGHEKVRARAWIGIIIAIAGIVFVVLAGGSSSGDNAGTDSLLGDILLLSATTAWAVYTVGSRDVVARYGPIAVTAVGLWAGTIGLILLGLPALLHVDFRALSPGVYGSMLYSGAFSLGLAYIFWYFGVRVLGNTRGSAFSNLAPVVSLIAAWPLLGEAPRLWQFAGAFVIIGGVTMTQMSNVQQSPIEELADEPKAPTTPPVGE
jgi:drug/metabolite transporter (DMT)-like permease